MNANEDIKAVNPSSDDSEHPYSDELHALLYDLFRIGMIPGDTGEHVCGSVSLRRENGFIMGGNTGGRRPEEFFASWSRLRPGEEEISPGGTCLEKLFSEEGLLHSAVYAGAKAAGCAAVLKHDELYGNLLKGKAPAADSDRSEGISGAAAGLKNAAAARQEDGIVVMPSLPGVFIMYAPNVNHLRDLLYMLGQGYIPF